MNKKGMLIILSGPSGCGKGSMVREILKNEKFVASVSATTRQPREGEIDGESYFFLTREDFERRIAENRLLEYAEYCGNYYGTPLDYVEEMRNKGKNVILEIEVQGAMQIMKKCPDVISIFAVPPTIAELSRRLHKRGTETEDVIAKRIARAKEELPLACNYQYIVINDALEDAVDDFFAIIRANACKYDFMKEIMEEFESC